MVRYGELAGSRERGHRKGPLGQRSPERQLPRGAERCIELRKN